jgi:hypothetical protein
MKKSLVIIVALLLLLTACQPTPEVDAVRQKNQSEMIEMAQATIEPVREERPTVQVRVETEGPDYRALYDIPEHLVKELTGADGRLTVHIDADVKVPDRPMPILRVHPVDFSQALVYELWDRLVGDTPMYLESHERTKQVIESEMQYYLAIANGDYENGMETPEEAREMLESLQKEYITAPDGQPPQRADGTLQERTAGSEETGEVWAKCTQLEACGRYSGKAFTIRNNFDNDKLMKDSSGGMPVTRGASMHYYSGNFDRAYDDRQRYPRIWVRRDDPFPEGVEKYLKTSPKEAWERAEAILAEVGISDTFRVAAVRLMPNADEYYDESKRTWVQGDLNGYGYEVHCARMVRGVPCNTTQHYSVYLFTFKDIAAPSWQPEEVTLRFGDGPAYEFGWSSPMAMDECLVEDSTLLPFSEIMDVVEKRLPLLLDEYARKPQLGEEGLTVDVNRIDLGLWRIREKDTVETGLLVPAWCFYLDMDIHTEHYDGGRRPMDILIVNAVNGTLVDPWNGY